MHTSTRIFLFALLGLASVATNSAPTSLCSGISEAPAAEGEYPDHQLSPQESLSHHDTVFLGEVAVPGRPCSLGFCAGLKVIRTLKGEPGATALVQVARAKNDPCIAAPFATRGSRWMVFANGGTSKKGQRFFQVAGDGPSFVAKSVPDFNALEGRYRMLRARLDDAIESKMGRVR